MPIRKKLSGYLPSADQFSRQKRFSFLGETLKDKQLWHLRRRSVALGVAIGLFCAFLPMPFETVVAVFLAIYFRANIPTAFIMVFVSNPLTWVILYTPAYQLGALITKPEAFKLAQLLNIDNYSLSKIFNSNNLMYQYFTLWVGCLIIGPIVAFFSYFLTLWSWQLHVISRWKERKRKRHLVKLIKKHQDKNQ